MNAEPDKHWLKGSGQAVGTSLASGWPQPHLHERPAWNVDTPVSAGLHSHHFVLLQTESGKGYDLDRSLFERLVKGGWPVATLEQQRRMRPSISTLIRNTIYPSLQVGVRPLLQHTTTRMNEKPNANQAS